MSRCLLLFLSLKEKCCMICTAEDVCCPYGLIFGGTDVNEYGIISDPHCKDIMLQAATNARFVVLCN